ncbi:MAG: PKD domain-containing protein [Bacteroidota bacterium]
MMKKRFLLSLLITFWISVLPHIQAQPLPTYQLARGGKVFKVYQFPRDQMPRIDGQTEDWEMVPEEYQYGTDLLKDTEDGQGTEVAPEDLEVQVTVGWVKGLNRLYFLYEAYDDYWDFGRFNPEGYLNDIFEIAVDGDLSGGPFIFNPIYDSEEMKWASHTPAYLENHFSFSGVHAQNYHIYTPPVNNAWVLVWGNQHWIAEFPQANYAYNYDFQPGESGKLVLECWITPYDYAPYEGPEQAIESHLEENKVIGLSWSILEFDGGEREGHINLAHDIRMVKDASYLCAFQLMPLEAGIQQGIQAEWTFEVVDMDQGLVAFRDESKGEISQWKWDFGDGASSEEQHPIHRFTEKGVHKVITLEVSGPGGSSKRTRYWEVMIR